MLVQAFQIANPAFGKTTDREAHCLSIRLEARDLAPPVSLHTAGASLAKIRCTFHVDHLVSMIILMGGRDRPSRARRLTQARFRNPLLVRCIVEKFDPEHTDVHGSPSRLIRFTRKLASASRTPSFSPFLKISFIGTQCDEGTSAVSVHRLTKSRR
jgi:hypothetical protein